LIHQAVHLAVEESCVSFEHGRDLPAHHRDVLWRYDFLDTCATSFNRRGPINSAYRKVPVSAEQAPSSRSPLNPLYEIGNDNSSTNVY
jgi:hypothetical protein